MAVTASDPDGGLISTDDMATKIDTGDFAGRKRLYETFRKPASMDMHSLGNVYALVQARALMRTILMLGNYSQTKELSKKLRL